MLGLIVNSEIGASRIASRAYSFEELIKPIKCELIGYYWILDNVYFKHIADDNDIFTDFEDKHNEIILEEIRNTKLTKKGFINEYAKFVIGDNDKIYGIEHKEYFNYYDEYNLQFIERYVNILFICVDAAYWEVYAKDLWFLNKIKSAFPNCINCDLQDRLY